jgi:hypothetical protein
MTRCIMKEWLEAFYKHIGPSREVLLAMDNFSAHITGLELAQPPSNIRICFLPPNSTSKFQPLDQGIIQAFKSHYRKQWLRHMLSCYERNEAPLDNMNVYLAIKWSLRSWNLDISSITISNCFHKSTILHRPLSLPTPTDSIDVSHLYEEVKRVGSIQDAMALSNFLNPEEETTKEDSSSMDDDLNEIIACQLGVGQEEDAEESIGPVKPIIQLSEAHTAMRLVLEYVEGHEAILTEHLRAMQRVELTMAELEQEGKVQTSLISWLI